jgi:hypothetical protein
MEGERENSDMRAICINLTLLTMQQNKSCKNISLFRTPQQFFFCSQSCMLETESYLHCFVLTSFDMGNRSEFPQTHQAIV